VIDYFYSISLLEFPCLIFLSTSFLKLKFSHQNQVQRLLETLRAPFRPDSGKTTLPSNVLMGTLDTSALRRAVAATASASSVASSSSSSSSEAASFERVSDSASLMDSDSLGQDDADLASSNAASESK
jgi:hypothetical protein